MRRFHLSLAAAIAPLALLSACASPDVPEQPVTAEKPWRLEGRAMAAAADPRAVDAALEVMAAGGSAVDAAIAAHTVLGLVEPQSSGLGGGGFMVIYDRKSNTTTVINGRDTAPAAATPDLFKWQGATLAMGPAILSGKSVGAPGSVAVYKAAHEKYGKLPWARVFDPAIRLADQGFAVSPRLADALQSPRYAKGPLGTNAESAAYFYPDGKPLSAGYVRTNPAYASTLRRVASEGPSAFYSGDIARGIVAAVRAGDVPGDLTEQDLADFTVQVTPAACGAFKTYRICSAPPPASGGIMMNQIMGLYERISKASTGRAPEDRLRDYVLAQQLGYADRDHYVADPDKVMVPTADLMNPAYLDHRAASGFKPGDIPQPGDPGAVLHNKPVIDLWGRDASTPMPGTTHLSFVDYEGNAVSMTMTVQSVFGSSRWTNGFLLNNLMTDFALEPMVNGKLVANAPAPGKRPRSSMSPSIVFDEAGDLFMVTGSPGGSSIVGYVSKTLVAALDWGMGAQQAVELPNVIARGQTVRVETSLETGKAWAKSLAEDGFKVQEVEGEISGLHVIIAREGSLEGGADPRREGVAKEIIR
jgi:gamma-glutamyltranspeptidase/glutathione hydrolase